MRSPLLHNGHDRRSSGSPVTDHCRRASTTRETRGPARGSRAGPHSRASHADATNNARAARRRVRPSLPHCSRPVAAPATKKAVTSRDARVDLSGTQTSLRLGQMGLPRD